MTPSTTKTRKPNQQMKKMAANLIFLFFSFINSLSIPTLAEALARFDGRLVALRCCSIRQRISFSASTDASDIVTCVQPA